MIKTCKDSNLFSPVDLCDSSGVLNPDAVGWSWVPLHNCH